MLQATEDELRNRAVAIKDSLGNLPFQIAIGRSTGRVGGGTLPKSMKSSVTIEILPKIVRQRNLPLVCAAQRRQSSVISLIIV